MHLERRSVAYGGGKETNIDVGFVYCLIFMFYIYLHDTFFARVKIH